MKRALSFLIVFLGISAGVYSSSRQQFYPVFYYSGFLCVEGVAMTCDAIGFPDCVQLVLPIDDSPIFFTQIYASRPDRYSCEEPYSHF